MTEAFKASLSALYARRAVAAEFACRGMLNPHTDSSEQWLLHDELFYKYAFDVPVPHFNSNANRAAFRRIPESDLPRADRVEHDVWLTWHRPEYATSEKKHVWFQDVYSDSVECSRQGISFLALYPQYSGPGGYKRYLAERFAKWEAGDAQRFEYGEVPRPGPLPSGVTLPSDMADGFGTDGKLAATELGIETASSYLLRNCPDDDGDVLEYYPEAVVHGDQRGDEDLPTITAEDLRVVTNEVDFA